MRVYKLKFYFTSDTVLSEKFDLEVIINQLFTMRLKNSDK